MSSSDAATIGTTFKAIPLASIRCETILDFDLFLETNPGELPVLFRERHLKFNQSVLDRLAEHKHAQLYVRVDQEADYRKYVEANLRALLSDPAIAVEQKTRLVYEAAQGIMLDILNDPRVGGVLKRSKDLTATTIDFMSSEEQSFKYLLKVISFDYYTYTHSIDVFVFSIALARRAGMRDTKVLYPFGQGALLHDIGKSSLPSSVVNQQGRLSDDQWRLMKQHPQLGCDILLEQKDADSLVLDVIRHHHEKLDGSGYPDGLSGDSVSHWARISTIADIFDALTTNRSYKPAMRSFHAFKLMKDEMGTHLDNDLFRTFVGLMSATD